MIPAPTDRLSVGRFPARSALTSALVVGGLLTSGCDPEVNVYGSFFPAWVLALAVGGLLTAALCDGFWPRCAWSRISDRYW